MAKKRKFCPECQRKDWAIDKLERQLCIKIYKSYDQQRKTPSGNQGKD